MSIAELIVCFVVALLVFGPSKLPMLAFHLGKIYNKVQEYQQIATKLWQNQIDAHQLLENTKKAEQADKQYSETKP